MKARTIRAVLRKKIGEWLDSITDDAVRTLAINGTIVTGGSIASMLLNEEVNDYDLYFKDYNTALAIANYYVDEFMKNPPSKFKANDLDVPISIEKTDERIKIVIKSAGIAAETGADEYQYFETLPDDSIDATQYVDNAMAIVNSLQDKTKPRYRPVFISTNAITLSNKIQLVIRFFGEPDQIHENYDFVHCTNYWTSWDSKLILKPDALETLLSKELRYVGSKYPLCSIIRTRKFIRRNWSITAGQYLKMIMQVNQLDLTDLQVLEDQLTGVDTAYFLEVIAKLKLRDDKVDSAYLAKIIDKMF